MQCQGSVSACALDYNSSCGKVLARHRMAALLGEKAHAQRVSEIFEHQPTPKPGPTAEQRRIFPPKVWISEDSIQS